MEQSTENGSATHTRSSRPGVFGFDHDHGVPAGELADLLGGKGAGVAEMTTALGINVPPGFTVSVPVCRDYRENGWPHDLDSALAEHVKRLASTMGRGLGDPDDPLLVAVRSGAPVSMPGMLDTVLNLGLNDETVHGFARRSGDERFAWESYGRFLHMFATTVMSVDAQQLPSPSFADDADAVHEQVLRLRKRIEDLVEAPVPSDPFTQLVDAVQAVFRSWDCPRARAYREQEGIDESMGTAVNVQAMVFGNRGARSGTGVVFTRNPSTGEPGPYGDYLPRAQGEDVVAGTANTMPVSHLQEHQPGAYAELLEVLRTLEVRYRDVCDVEFTLEEGHLWLLQTRVGKRGAIAAVRIAVDLVDDPDIRLTPAEALDRVPQNLRERARQEILAQAADVGDDKDLLGSGLGAAPGRASGRVVLSSDSAATGDGDVILVRKETSPEDVAGMAASAGVLTTRGGLVSHAAVVARGWGIPAVVGAENFTLTDDAFHTEDGCVVREGEVITVDGTSGMVWRGAVTAENGSGSAALDDQLPHLARLEAWANSQPQLTQRPMRITVDRDKCSALGICESVAPEFFEVNDEGELSITREDVPEDQQELIEQAMANCPTGALSIDKGRT